MTVSTTVEVAAGADEAIREKAQCRNLSSFVCGSAGGDAGGLAGRVAGALLLAGLIAGLVFRLRMFFMNRSLWLDPAMLALNLVSKGYGALFGSLDLNQSAPVGFLLVSKLIGSMFGYSEYSLMALPLFFGIGSLFLFLALSCRMLGVKAAPLAFLPFAACSTAVYYSGELKQYEGDLFFSVLILLVAHTAVRRRFDRRSILGFVIAGLVAVWFSHTAILVLAGTGMVLAIHALLHEREALPRLLVAGAALAVHFLALYVLQMRPAAQADLFAAHAKGFAPWPRPGAGFGTWWSETITGFVSFPLGFGRWRLLPLAGLASGLVAAVASRRRRLDGMLLLFPLLLLVAVSMAHLYPIETGLYDIHSRFVLFAVPSAFLLIGLGLDAFSKLTWKPVLVSAILGGVLVWTPVQTMIRWPGFMRQEMRPLVKTLRSGMEADDAVYVYYAAVPAFRFYTRKAPIPFIAVNRTLTPRSADPHQLARAARARKLWVVVSHDSNKNRLALITALEGRGKGVHVDRFPGAWLYSVVQEPR
ncbi:MAG: hypothetical protein GXP47_15155 [Acidobacteria bacterium]|nr:hypothetical protein [Acidobacteriota bacterium]